MSRTRSSPTVVGSISAFGAVRVTVHAGRRPAGSRVPVGRSMERVGTWLAVIAAAVSR